MFAHDLGDGLRLRLPEMRDAERIFAAIDASREHLRPWHPWVDGTTDPASLTGFIQRQRTGWADGKGFSALILRGDVVVGVCGFADVDLANRRAAVGYWLRADEQGKGIVTRAVRAFLDWGFREAGFNRIILRCGTENLRSAAVARRLGFREEGVLRQNEWIRGRAIDHLAFAMLAEEWPGSA